MSCQFHAILGVVAGYVSDDGQFSFSYCHDFFQDQLAIGHALVEYGVAHYWNEISAAAPHTDFVIYNIPQLAGVALTPSLYKEMLKNPRVIGVKNSSMPVQDIQTFASLGGDNHIVFNGPDEQFLGGRLMGAHAGIGGT